MSIGRPIFHRGERCGYVIGDTFERLYNSRLHVLRKHSALSFHRSVIAQLAGVVWVCAIDETDRQRWATLDALKRFGIPVQDPIHGPQLALPLSQWRPSREDDAPGDTGPRLVQGELL